MTPVLCAGLAARGLDARARTYSASPPPAMRAPAATLIGKPAEHPDRAGGTAPSTSGPVSAAVVPALDGPRPSPSAASPCSGAEAGLWAPRRRCRAARGARRSTAARPPSARSRSPPCWRCSPRRCGAISPRCSSRAFLGGQPHRREPAAARRDRPAAAHPVRVAVRGERRLRPDRRAGRRGARRSPPMDCCRTASRCWRRWRCSLSNTIGNVPAVVLPSSRSGTGSRKGR